MAPKCASSYATASLYVPRMRLRLNLVSEHQLAPSEMQQVSPLHALPGVMEGEETLPSTTDAGPPPSGLALRQAQAAGAFHPPCCTQLRHPSSRSNRPCAPTKTATVGEGGGSPEVENHSTLQPPPGGDHSPAKPITELSSRCSIFRSPHGQATRRTFRAMATCSASLVARRAVDGLKRGPSNSSGSFFSNRIFLESGNLKEGQA